MMNKDKSSSTEHTAKEKLHPKHHSANEPIFTDEEIDFSSADDDVEIEMEEFSAANHRTSAGCGCGCGSHNAHY